MDEFTVGARVRQRAPIVFRFNVVHKRDTNGTKTLDLAMPYDAYTDVRSAVDPGRDNVVGTADDGVMYAWSVPRTYPGFGQVNTLDHERERRRRASRRYRAYEATFSKMHSRWLVDAGQRVAADVADIERTGPAESEPDALHLQPPRLELLGEVERHVSAAVRHHATPPPISAQSGELYGRSAQMRNALNSLVTVLVEPRVGRYEWVRLWDNRFTKTIALANRQSLEASLDFYNTLNSAAVLSQVNVNGPDYLKPSSGSSSAATATATLPPRIFRLGARWRF